MASSAGELSGEKSQDVFSNGSRQYVSPTELHANEKKTTVEPVGKARAILISTMIVMTQLVQVRVPFNTKETSTCDGTSGAASKNLLSSSTLSKFGLY